MRIPLIMLLLPLFVGCDKLMKPILIGGSASPTGTIAHNQIILVIGQSNNVRWQQYGESSFVQDYHKQNPSATVRFINCSVGGTSISQWQYQGVLMNQCQMGGLTPTVIFFYQGEADAAIGTTNWAQQFMSAVAGFRKTFNNPNLPVIYAQIAVEDPAIYCPQPQWDSIIDQQMSLSIHNVTMIKTSDISALDPDASVAQGVHLSPQSYINISARYAQALEGSILDPQ